MGRFTHVQTLEDARSRLHSQRTELEISRGQIFKDLQVFAELQIQLTKAELQGELRRRSVAFSILALGIGLLGLFAILAAIGSVHFLHWVTLPQGKGVETIPL